MRFLSSMSAYLLVVSFFRSGLGSYVVEVSWTQRSCHPYEKQPHSRFPGPLDPAILPAFPPHCSLSPQLGMCYRCINWAGHSNITLDQFWFSIMVSICYKASLKMGLHLAVSMKVNMLECSKELYWFSNVATVGSPVGSIISLALRSCLHFQQRTWFPPAELALSAINYYQVTTKTWVSCLPCWVTVMV